MHFTREAVFFFYLGTQRAGWPPIHAAMQKAQLINLFSECITKEQLDGARMTQLAAQDHGHATLANMALKYTDIQDDDSNTRLRIQAMAALVLQRWRQKEAQD